MASFSVSDLTDEESRKLRGLRKRKMELIDEIAGIKNELKAVDAELETLYYVDEGSKTRSRLFVQGKKKFNASPNKGIDFLCERGLIERTPDSVALFFYQNTGLSKAAMGDYLGQNEPFVLDVLDSFVRLHELSQMHVVDALRLFLWSFRLPGESQKIDRIMDKFSVFYCEQNPAIFHSKDDCFLVCYSTIMLNTLLHNPSVKDKPTFERFVEMNREMMDQLRVPQQMLLNVYESIKQQPFKIPEDDSKASDIFLNTECDGWMYKQSSNQFISGPLSWKRRWFVLSDACLYYFDTQHDKEPKGMIPLQNVGIKRAENISRSFVIEIYSLTEQRVKACKKEDGKTFEVHGRHSVYRVAASSQEEFVMWMEKLSGAAQPLPPRPNSTH